MLVVASTSLFFYLLKEEFADDPADENGVTVVFPSWSTSRSRSEHYEFIYPTNVTASANIVVTAATAHGTRGVPIRPGRSDWA